MDITKLVCENDHTESSIQPLPSALSVSPPSLPSLLTPSTLSSPSTSSVTRSVQQQWAYSMPHSSSLPPSRCHHVNQGDRYLPTDHMHSIRNRHVLAIPTSPSLPFPMGMHNHGQLGQNGQSLTAPPISEPWPSTTPLRHQNNLLHLLSEKQHHVQPQMQHSPQQQQRVECRLCGKNFSGISSHNRHVSRTHHKARPFSCTDCGLQFGQKGSLDRHTAAVHLKARPFNCEFCGKGFGRKDNMKIHMTTVHLKRKPFKCDMCIKSFGGKRPLKIHRQTVHFKERPLQCPYCHKRFGQRSNLNVHIKVHKRCMTNGAEVLSPPQSPSVSADGDDVLAERRFSPLMLTNVLQPHFVESQQFVTSPI